MDQSKTIILYLKRYDLNIEPFQLKNSRIFNIIEKATFYK